MDCNDAKKYLWDYLDGKPDDRIGLKFHLNHCSDCRKELADLKAIVDFIGFEKIANPNPFFVEKAMFRISSSVSQPSLISEIRSKWTLILKPAFAVFTIGFSIVLGIYLGTPDSRNIKDEDLESFTQTYDLGAQEVVFLID